MQKYKLAVIIPCWNCAEEIGAMLDSILVQTFNDWNVFCVDDQSTDDTLNVLQKYQKKDSRIHIYIRNRQPKGAQTCRNIGLDLSEGAEYVIWFDSDDIIAPYCFEQRVAFMDMHPDLDFSVFPAKSFSENIWEYKNSHLFGFRYAGVDDLCRFLRRTLPWVGWTNIYKRSSLISYQLKWDENILSLQDSDFNIQSILKGLKYDYAKNARIDYFWRIQNTGITKKIFTNDHKRSHVYYFNKLCESLSEQQRTQYALELDDYLFFFIDRFYNDWKFVFSMIRVDGVKNRPIFQLRILLYCFLHKRFKRVRFPHIVRYRVQYDKECSQYNRALLLSMLERKV